MAMKNVGVTIIGAEYVEDTFRHVLPAEGNRIAKRTITKVAAEVRDDMRQRAPKGDGTLRKAIKSRRRRGEPGMAEAGVFVEHGSTAKNDAFYWWMVENGTVKMQAQPYIVPTVEEWSGKVTDAYERLWWPEFGKEMIKRARKQGKKI